MIVATRPLCESVAAALADAFIDDPVMSWILPDPRSRNRQLTGLFRLLLRIHYLQMDSVWTTPGTLGAALWAPPGHASIATATILMHVHEIFRTLGSSSLRALRALTYVDRHHPAEPHWYLGVLGTHSAHQGAGIGSALLAPVLSRCDEGCLPAYLESSNEANIPFYRRHGFEVTDELHLPGGGPPVWPMWREPQATR